MKTKCKHVKILDKKTNKVANELNKPGISKKTKQKCNREKGNTPHKRQFSRCKRDGGRGREERVVWGEGGCSGFH